MERKIEICWGCKGYGVILKDIDPDPRDATHEQQECPECKGAGRLLVQTEVKTFTKPFKFSYDRDRFEMVEK